MIELRVKIQFDPTSDWVGDLAVILGLTLVGRHARARRERGSARGELGRVLAQASQTISAIWATSARRMRDVEAPRARLRVHRGDDPVGDVVDAGRVRVGAVTEDLGGDRR
jgi:hypothetical protein